LGGRNGITIFDEDASHGPKGTEGRDR